MELSYRSLKNGDYEQKHRPEPGGAGEKGDLCTV
jgi:hypothetical protein